MKPTQREFEKVKTDDFISGVLIDVKYDQAHEFKGKNPRTSPAVKFIFDLDGYKDKKQSNWMGFSYDEKSTLYQKYLVSLVESAKPYMDFDLDQLKGIEVKILYKDSPDGKYQNIDTIRPTKGKIKADAKFTPEEHEDEPLPF